MKEKLLFPEEINERVKNGMGCGSQIGEGWFDLVKQLDSDIAAIAPEYKVDQVKEKFGCYDNKTEVLTHTGWKLFKNCNKLDKFAILNDDNRILRSL